MASTVQIAAGGKYLNCTDFQTMFDEIAGNRLCNTEPGNPLDTLVVEADDNGVTSIYIRYAEGY